MTDLKIGGVPEHFNYPWYQTLKNKAYKQYNINLRWQDFHGGTGQMTAALRNGDVDIAIVLTEGIIKDIGQGNPSKIVQTFIKSPLIWGIHVAKNAPFKTMQDLEDATVAISRFGSGSHLMAIVNAHNLGWDITRLKFKVVGDLQGGIDALTKGEADYFMWEHFTTKPYVDNHILSRLGDCPTPWPCFVIAVRDEIIANNADAVKQILSIINKQTRNFKKTLGIETTLANRYQQDIADIQKWLSITEWESEHPIEAKLIDEVQNKMKDFGVIDSTINTYKLIKNMYL